MKKNFKLMLLGLLAMGSSTAFAQIHVGEIFPDGDFVYEVTTEAVANGKAGEVKIIGVREGKNPVYDKALTLKATCSATVFEDKYSFYVTEFDDDALRTVRTITGVYVGTFTGQVNAESVEFPKYIKGIPLTALDGYTNMKTVTFETGSNLVAVNNFAFATTQIEEFDFSNCKKLAGLDDEVFVEAGKTNSYITKVTLPGTTLFKSIGAAFRNLTSLTTISGLENSSVTTIITDAFSGDKNLKTLELPNTIKTIQDYALRGSGVETLTVDVTALEKLGEGNEVYSDAVADRKLKKLTLKGNLSGVIGTNAFKDQKNLETLDLSALNFASKGQIAGGAFQGCDNSKFTSVKLGDILDQPTAGYTIAASAFKDCKNLNSFTVGNINSANAIEGAAFDGCEKLATVTIGNIVANNVIAGGAFSGCAKLATVKIGDINGASVIGALAFGNQLKDVTIGTVKAGAAAILTNAFKYADVSGATLSLAKGGYVSSDDASTAVIATDAFDFSAVINAGAKIPWTWPVVTIGEIRSQGGAFAAQALKGNNIASITFDGNIAKKGLDKMIIYPTCTVSKLVFNGTIGIGGIATGAFKELPATKVEITFNGELAEGAIAAKAFESLRETSVVDYTKAVLTDATVNPFDKQAFSDGTADETTPRIIDLKVKNSDLEAAYKDNVFEGLGTNGTFDIYLVKFWEKTPDPVDYNKFYVYQDGTSTTAWARFWVSDWKDLNDAYCDKKIARYQTVEGGAKVKLTLYGTYTDDPGAGNDVPTIFMVPLKALNGFYEINQATDEAVIVKAEIINGGTFADKNVELSFTTTIADNSWWGSLHNEDLFINTTIVTNQQLIDKTVDLTTHGAPVADIYTGSNIAYDLYVMNNPAKYKGFRIDQNPISKDKKTYIGEGWWCMLLRKTTTPANIVWMDDAEATGIFDVIAKKDVVEDGAIYTLQGIRVSTTQKGQIYIQNGKKFLAK